MSEPAGHGYRNFLSLAEVLAEARAIADGQGLAAVSMRALAGRLDCTPRALYRHVAGKTELLELVADAALAELAVPAEDAPWAPALFEFFDAMRTLLVSSPAVAEIIATQAVAGPNFRQIAERLVALLLHNEFSPELAAEAVVALAQFTLGASVPGTSQQLHDAYRTRPNPDNDRPALRHVTQHFTADNATNRFRGALKRLIRAYEPGRS